MSDPRRQSGSVAVLVAVNIPIIIGLMALSIDVGRLYLVRAQLQGAADAGALAAVRYFAATDPSVMRTQGVNAVRLNSADGKALSSALIEKGCWGSASAGATQAFVVGNTCPTASGSSYMPAVRATVARDASADGVLNGGPLSLFFAGVIGKSKSSVSATAIAVSSTPNCAPKGFLLPLALPLCIYNQYWNPLTGQPLANPPTEIVLQTLNANGSCSGVWTIFNDPNGGAASVTNYLENGSPIDYRLGDFVNTANGTMTTLYGTIETGVLANGGLRNKTIMVPIVRDDPGGTTRKQIIAFAPIQITRSVGGNTQAVFGKLVSGQILPPNQPNQNSGICGERWFAGFGGSNPQSGASPYYDGPYGGYFGSGTPSLIVN